MTRYSHSSPSCGTKHERKSNGAPTDHRILDRIAWMMNANFLAATRLSESVEFYDRVKKQWYKIVVCPIDAPETDEMV